jgi:hypothetical protein
MAEQEAKRIVMSSKRSSALVNSPLGGRFYSAYHSARIELRSFAGGKREFVKRPKGAEIGSFSDRLLREITIENSSGIHV